MGSGEEEQQGNVAEQLIEAVLEKVVACVAPIRSRMLLRSVLLLLASIHEPSDRSLS